MSHEAQQDPVNRMITRAARLEEAGRVGDAIAALEAARDREPEEARYFSALFRTYGRAQRWREAIHVALDECTLRTRQGMPLRATYPLAWAQRHASLANDLHLAVLVERRVHAVVAFLMLDEQTAVKH